MLALVWHGSSAVGYWLAVSYNALRAKRSTIVGLAVGTTLSMQQELKVRHRKRRATDILDETNSDSDNPAKLHRCTNATGIVLRLAHCGQQCYMAWPRAGERGHASSMRGHDHDQFSVETKKTIGVKSRSAATGHM